MRFGGYIQFSVFTIITMVIYMDLQQRREVPAPAGPDHKQPFEEGCLRLRLSTGVLRFQGLPLGGVATELSPGCRTLIEELRAAAL